MLFSVCPGIVSTISWTNKKKKTLSSSSLLLQCAAYLPAGSPAAAFFFRCRVSSSAGKPSGLAHRSLRSIARRLACVLLICVALQGDDLSLSLVCLGGGIHAQKLERQRRTGKKKPKTKQMQEAGRGESRRDSRGLLTYLSVSSDLIPSFCLVL